MRRIFRICLKARLREWEWSEGLEYSWRWKHPFRDEIVQAWFDSGKRGTMRGKVRWLSGPAKRTVQIAKGKGWKLKRIGLMVTEGYLRETLKFRSGEYEMESVYDTKGRSTTPFWSTHSFGVRGGIGLAAREKRILSPDEVESLNRKHEEEAEEFWKGKRGKDPLHVSKLRR